MSHTPFCEEEYVAERRVKISVVSSTGSFRHVSFAEKVRLRICRFFGGAHLLTLERLTRCGLILGTLWRAGNPYFRALMQGKWGFVWINFFSLTSVIKMNENLKPQVLSISLQNQRESRVGCILFSSQCLKRCYSWTVCSVVASMLVKIYPCCSVCIQATQNIIWHRKVAQ